MFTKSIKTAAFAAVASFATITSANANLFLDFNNAPSALQCTGCGTTGTTIGYTFSTTTTLEADAFGFWVFDGFVVTPSNQVGLWDDQGALLASTTITPASTTGSTAGTGGQWLFENNTPVTLTPGDYTIGAVVFDAGPGFLDGQDTLYSNDGTFDLIAGLTLGRGVTSALNAGLALPTVADSVFGPQIRVGATLSGTQVQVSEPASLALLGLGLAGVAVSRRRAA